MDRIYSHTTSICPVCGTLVPARIMERDGRIVLEKLCPSDGMSCVVICSDPEWYRLSRSYVKPGQAPLEKPDAAFAGCPNSCGLCQEHRQHTCLPVIEITSDCDLECPVCLKEPDDCCHMSPFEYVSVLERLIACEGEVPVINLSGGEPTLHPDFAELIRISAESGVMQTTVSTNGVRMHADRGLRDLFRSTGTIAALQFDGFDPDAYRVLRGKDLSRQKLELIEMFEAEGVRYSLTATLMRGVNDHEITAITDFFFRSGAMSLMFQPAAFTGRAAAMSGRGGRLTIPDVVKDVEKSSFVREGDFNPLPCSHYSCFALSYHVLLEDEVFMSLKDFLGCDDYLNIIANRTLPGLDKDGYELIRDRICGFWSAADSSADNERVLRRIRHILRELSSTPFSPRRVFELGSASMKGVFIHQFMDRDTFDLGRLMKCCNHYPQKDGRMVPMCSRNIFRG